jgi:TPR repeat protein
MTMKALAGAAALALTLLAAGVTTTGAMAAGPKNSATPHPIPADQAPDAPDGCRWQGPKLLCRSPEGAWIVTPHSPKLTRATVGRAAAGDTRAMVILGGFYDDDGPPARRDFARARGYYLKAAEAGDMSAVEGLTSLLRRGYGGPEDLDGAVSWARKGVAAGAPGAYYQLGRLYGAGKGVETDQKEAVRLFRYAAEHGVPRAMIFYAFALEAGDGLPKDAAAAAAWYRKAGDGGELRGYGYLAILMIRGEGTDKDVEGGLKLLKDTAARGNADAMEFLGAVYHGMAGVPEDAVLARDWTLKAAMAEEPSVSAQSSIGVMMMTGYGGPKDFAEGIRWLRLAAEDDDVSALYNLGVAYETGEGVARDEGRARVYFRKAAALGSDEARKALKSLGEVET